MIITNENFDDFSNDCSRRCYVCDEYYCERIVEYRPNHVIIKGDHKDIIDSVKEESA